MTLIGDIVRLQIQTTSLKVGDRLARRYDPAGIILVPSLEVDPGGVTGITGAEVRLDDVHHADHTHTKSRGTNGVSILFTPHYERMREGLGDHLIDGIAGENILVACSAYQHEADVAAGFRIVTGAGETVELRRVIVAAPCVEFGRFALRFPDDQRPDRRVTDAVAFLSDGMRGYYAGYDGSPVRIEVGDHVYRMERAEENSVAGARSLGPTYG